MTSKSESLDPAPRNLDPAQIEARLVAERDALDARVRDGNAPTSPPESHRQPAEASVDDVTLDLEFHSREATSARLALVEIALMRLRGGSYGRCEECGEAIAPARLANDPAVPRCVACQSSTEPPVRGATM